MTAGCTPVKWALLSAFQRRQSGMSGTAAPNCVRGLLVLAARYTEQQPRGFEMKENMTLMKRYVGTVVRSDCTVPAKGCKRVNADLGPCLVDW
jgi:hypothetical protein